MTLKTKPEAVGAKGPRGGNLIDDGRRGARWSPKADRRAALLAGLCGLVVLGQGCPSTPARNPKMSATQYKLGHDYFDRALKAESTEVRVRYVNVALQELERAIAADDENDHAHFLIAMVYLFKGQQSVEEMSVYQCLRGDEAKEYRQEGDSLMRLAQKHLERAYALRKEKDSRIALNLSTVSLHFGDNDAAERYARRALDDISYGTPHLARGNVGRAQFARGEHLKALKNLKQAVFSEPRFCPGHYWLGRVEFAAKRNESALQRFQDALTCCGKEKIAPIQDAMLYRGLTLSRLGRTEEAREVLQACSQQAPKSCVAERCLQSMPATQGGPR